jgi:hypothetical protein
MLRTKKEESINTLLTKYYKGEMEAADMTANFGAMDILGNGEWAGKMTDGSLAGMLDSVTKLFVEFGRDERPVVGVQVRRLQLLHSRVQEISAASTQAVEGVRHE